MRTLVTGATGFVGGHLVDRLLERGDTVTALVRSPAKAVGLAERGVRLVRGDLADHAALAEATADQDVIHHVAALTGAVDEAEFLAANRDGTDNLARAALAQPTPPRLVLVSSGAAGGPCVGGVARHDAGDDRPVTMYGRSKLASERVVRDLALPWVILRPPTVYGPRDRDNLLTVFKAARFGVAPVFGTGSMRLSLIHVADLADAIVLAGVTPGLEGRTFYVNHPEVLTSAELVRGIAASIDRSVRLLPIPRWAAAVALTTTGGVAGLLKRKTILRADKIHEFFQDAWTGDPAPFVAATGWAPRFDLRTGMADTAAWYRAHGWL